MNAESNIALDSFLRPLRWGDSPCVGERRLDKNNNKNPLSACLVFECLEFKAECVESVLSINPIYISSYLLRFSRSESRHHPSMWQLRCLEGA